MEWLVPWKESLDSAQGVEELYREVPRGHPLRGISVSCLGFRQDCDDFIFALNDGTRRVAVAHLTFSVETDSRWPSAEIFASLEEFERMRMLPDNEEWIG